MCLRVLASEGLGWVIFHIFYLGSLDVVDFIPSSVISNSPQIYATQLLILFFPIAWNSLIF